MNLIFLKKGLGLASDRPRPVAESQHGLHLLKVETILCKLVEVARLDFLRAKDINVFDQEVRRRELALRALSTQERAHGRRGGARYRNHVLFRRRGEGLGLDQGWKSQVQGRHLPCLFLPHLDEVLDCHLGLCAIPLKNAILDCLVGRHRFGLNGFRSLQWLVLVEPTVDRGLAWHVACFFDFLELAGLLKDWNAEVEAAF